MWRRNIAAMSRKKLSTTIYVTPEQNDRLKLLHERTKVPVAVYIREGIDLVLRQYGHLLPGQLSLAPGSSLENVTAAADAVSLALPTSPSASNAAESLSVTPAAAGKK